MTVAGSAESAPAPERLALGAAFAAIYLIWGGTFLAIRYAVAEVPPLLTVAIRCGFGAVLLTAWCAFRGDLRRTTAAQWRVAATAAAFLFLICHGLLAWGEQRVPSGQTALLMTSIPLWLVSLEAIKTRQVPSSRVLLGLGIGVLGVFILTRESGVGGSGTQLERAGLLLGGLSWAVGSLVTRHGDRPESAIQSTAMQLGVGAALLATASLVTGEIAGWSPRAVSPRALLALAFLVICGSTVAFAAYTWLLRVSTLAAVGTYAFVNPVVAVVLAWGVGDDVLGARTMVAAALVVGAVVLARSRSARTASLRGGRASRNRFLSRTDAGP